VNVVQREGVSFSHPARFVLVGTMNPEEGEVRPQLLDRFGLCVDVQALPTTGERVEVMRRRNAWEDDPDAFAREWRAAEEALTGRLADAARRLPMTALADDLLFLIATISTEMGVDGHRADLVMSRAATALAALEGAEAVGPAHVRRVAPLVLAHRVRRRPFEDDALDERRLDTIVGSAASAADQGSAGEPGGAAGPGAAESPAAKAAASIVAVEAAADGAEVPVALTTPLDRLRRAGEGRRQESRSDDGRGRYVRSEPVGSRPPTDIAVDATIRAAAPRQSSRTGDMAIRVEREDLQRKVRKRRVGASIVFCVDASGSMGASTRMEATKAAVLDLLVDAYQRRDRVGLVSFRGDAAELLLSPTGSVELAQLKLRELATGGATPLAHGILKSLEVLEAEVRRNDTTVPWLVLLTDGRANVGLDGGLGSEDARMAATKARGGRVNVIVIDTDGTASATAAREIARLTGGDYVRLPRVDGGALVTAVRGRLEAV
jgi:magnesium chelatase subunit D